MTGGLHTVSIADYGTVRVRALGKRELAKARRDGGISDLLFLSHVVRLGMVVPQCDDAFLESIRATPDVLAAISDAILARSWPNRKLRT